MALLLTLLSILPVGVREANASQAGESLTSRNFELIAETEVGLEIEARSPGASWARKGAEAAALLVKVDGLDNQDVLLWAGDSPFPYRVSLGRLTAGKHTVSVHLNPKRSAAGAQHAEVLSLRLILLGSDSLSNDEKLALSYSPVLYQRANTIDRFSDIPLLMYYEVSRLGSRDLQIRYTVIFTNEDGGTPSAALMARWGRATDIEWVYQLRVRDGRIVEEQYQGVEHETKSFTGERTGGNHPLLAVASDNNNFSDQACSNVRFALLPVATDLRNAARESVMDAFPWTYRLMAEELMREGRVRYDTFDINSISDPRRYLYIELQSNQKGTAVAVEVTSQVMPKVVSSDLGEPKLRIERSGYFRTAIQLPTSVSPASLSSLTVRCYPTNDPSEDRVCQNVKVKSVMWLDQDYRPQPLQIQRVPQQTLKSGATLVIETTNSAFKRSEPGPIVVPLF
jgi:hypothetical protein